MKAIVKMVKYGVRGNGILSLIQSNGHIIKKHQISLMYIKCEILNGLNPEIL